MIYDTKYNTKVLLVLKLKQHRKSPDILMFWKVHSNDGFFSLSGFVFQIAVKFCIYFKFCHQMISNIIHYIKIMPIWKSLKFLKFTLFSLLPSQRFSIFNLCFAILETHQKYAILDKFNSFFLKMTNFDNVFYPRNLNCCYY